MEYNSAYQINDYIIRNKEKKIHTFIKLPNFNEAKASNRTGIEMQSNRKNNVSILSANSTKFKFNKNQMNNQSMSILEFYKSISDQSKARRKPTIEMFSKLENKNQTHDSYRNRLRKQDSVEFIHKRLDSSSSFEPELNGRPCIIAEKKTDHLIRMNYIQYVKTQFYEMRMKEEQMQNQETSDYSYNISTPNLEALRLKVYNFYQKFKDDNEISQGLLSIDEYLKNCASIQSLENGSMHDELISGLNIKINDSQKENKNYISSLNHEESQHKIIKNNIPVLDITPKSQQTKRAMPRTYLRAVKKLRNSDLIINSQLLNCKRMRIYEDALAMLDQIRSNENDESNNISATAQSTEEEQSKRNADLIGMINTSHDDLMIINEESRLKERSPLLTGKDSPNHVIFQRHKDNSQSVTPVEKVANSYNPNEAGGFTQYKLNSYSPLKVNTNKTTIDRNKSIINDDKIQITDDKSIRRVVINRNDSKRYYNTNNIVQRVVDHNNSVQYNLNKEYFDNIDDWKMLK